MLLQCPNVPIMWQPELFVRQTNHYQTVLRLMMSTIAERMMSLSVKEVTISGHGLKIWYTPPYNIFGKFGYVWYLFTSVVTCNGVQCADAETCLFGLFCTCGSFASCKDNPTGEVCDPTGDGGSGVCKCTSSLDKCATNEICDSDNNVCKCGSGSSCAGLVTGSYCDGSICKCSATEDACDSGIVCENEMCQGNFSLLK